MKSRLLLVACATDLLPSLSTNLAETGCRVRFATSGLELLKKARRRLPDLIVLDATLPDMDVTTVCEILSRLPSTATVPRLLLAARKCTFSEALPISGSPGDFRMAWPEGTNPDTGVLPRISIGRAGPWI